MQFTEFKAILAQRMIIKGHKRVRRLFNFPVAPRSKNLAQGYWIAVFPLRKVEETKDNFCNLQALPILAIISESGIFIVLVN